MLKDADLAGRSDFDAGPLHISPGRRLLEGPAGSTSVEPIVMKVFLLLLDAAGSVVTRKELFDHAWGGVFVGDDSLNRAIARVRKIASETAPGLFEIETIPRTGYRMTGSILDDAAQPNSPQTVPQSALSRRTVIVGAAVTGMVGTAAVAIWKNSHDQAARFDGLVREARESLDYDDRSTRPVELLKKAVALKPSDPAAQGLLAYATIASADEVNKDRSSNAAVEAEDAAAAALRGDPANADAKVARILLQRPTLDLLTTEDRLRSVLAAAPNNIFAMRHLWNLLQSVGRSGAAMETVKHALAIKPLSAACNFPLAQLLWITGRTAEADRVIDRAMQYWPDHPYVRWARFTIFAFTGRAKAALAMLDRADMRPQHLSPESVALWRSSLMALDTPSASNIPVVRLANVEAVKRDPRQFSRQALLCLSALRQVDAAFEVANLLLAYRPASPHSSVPGRAAGSTAWAFVPFLFVPTTAPLRADHRFAALADGIGLTAYWAKRGIGPDYKIAGA